MSDMIDRDAAIALADAKATDWAKAAYVTDDGRLQNAARVYAAHEIIAAIRALPAIEPAPAWQPIETAPKDGRWMLGAWINADDGCGYVTATVRYEGGADWREKIGMECGGPCSCPTHWQPLPEPPK